MRDVSAVTAVSAGVGVDRGVELRISVSYSWAKGGWCGERNLPASHVHCGLCIVTFRNAHKPTHTQTLKAQAHKACGMDCDCNGPSFGGTFNCSVIVSMLSVSQSIKPH